MKKNKNFCATNIGDALT